MHCLLKSILTRFIAQPQNVNVFSEIWYLPSKHPRLLGAISISEAQPHCASSTVLGRASVLTRASGNSHSKYGSPSLCLLHSLVLSLYSFWSLHRM